MTIGVQQGSYTVQEDVGFATVCAEVVEGVVGRDTDIILSTGDNTAEGLPEKYMITHVCSVLLLCAVRSSIRPSAIAVL